MRDELASQVGDSVQFIEGNGGFRLMPPTRDITTLNGIVAKPKKAESLQDMRASIAARAARGLQSKR